MSLFNKGATTLDVPPADAGFSINVDALDDDDIATLAVGIAQIVGYFAAVEAVQPTGVRLAAALEGYKTSHGPLLIVDGVCTDGATLEAQRAGRDPTETVGVVVFNHGELPVWCRALFTVHSMLRT